MDGENERARSSSGCASLFKQDPLEGGEWGLTYISRNEASVRRSFRACEHIGVGVSKANAAVCPSVWPGSGMRGWAALPASSRRGFRAVADAVGAGLGGTGGVRDVGPRGAGREDGRGPVRSI